MQALPYGYTWDSDGGGVTNGRMRPLTAAEWQAGSGANPASAAPDAIRSPPPMLGGGGGGENVYQDENGTYRNRRQSPGATRAPSGGVGGPVNFGGGGAPAAPAGGGGAGGGNMGGGSTATGGGQYSGMGGGGGMAAYGGSTAQQVTQNANLDPSVWNTPVNYGSANAAAGQAGGYAAGLANINPQVGAPDRTLYDRYSALLQDPTMGMNNPAAQFALKEAQQATQRQLGAGRMRNSGNALREMSDATTGTLMQQFGNLANIYGQGAGLEGQRWASEQGLGLDAQKLKLAGLQGAGDLAIRSGQLYGQTANQGLAERELDLRRVTAGIDTANESQAQDIRAQAVQQANAGGYGAGNYSPSLSQQYLSLTGTPLTLSSQGNSYSPWSSNVSLNRSFY